MPAVYTSLRLPSPPQLIWDILTDFEHYSDWNPVYQKISGDQCSEYLNKTYRSNRLVTEANNREAGGRIHTEVKNPRTSKGSQSSRPY